MEVRVRAETVRPCGGPVGTDRDKEKEKERMYSLLHLTQQGLRSNS